MRFSMVLCLLLAGASAFAEEEAMRNVKTANPFILLHPCLLYTSDAADE